MSESKENPDSEKSEPEIKEVVVAPEATVVQAPPVAKKQQFLIVDLVLGASVLAVLAFITCNVVVLALAQNYNERMCLESIKLAGQAAFKGEDTPALQLAALHYLDSCAQNGFFVEHPAICSFEDKISPTLRKLTISMATKVRVPVTFFIFDKSALDKDGQHVTYVSTCIYKLKNPKNCQGSHKLAPNPDAAADDANEQRENSDK